MMMRLKEMQAFDSPDMAEAARLLGILAPAAPSQSLANRLYAKLNARRVGKLRLVRAVVFVSILLVSTAILSATLVRQWRPVPSEPSSRPSVTRPSSPHPSLPTPAPVAATPTQVAPAPPSAAPTPFAPTSPPKASPRADRPASHGRGTRRVASGGMTPAPSGSSDNVASTEARATAAPPEEAALVLSALRALRREHSPARSGILVDHYLSNFPHGVLVEEALAVGIEAAISRGDASSATRLATEYLRQYPHGRFAKLAHKASDGSKP